jgi:hypothetical protein
MSELKAEIQTALQSHTSIARERVRGWIRDARDVETLALLYRLTDEGWDQIVPELETDETCALIQQYLLRCIREDTQDGAALPRQEAAGELEVWFDHLASKEDKQTILQRVTAAVTDLYLSGDEQVRRAIETGFLEHVLEQVKLRVWFSPWANDERLRDAWHHGLAWGQAHPDYMKHLCEQLRALQPRE